MLPCGHIFGYNCILRWIEGEKSNRCPLCTSFILIFRIDAQFGYPKGFLEHFAYDNHPDVWLNNLRSLLNSLLIYTLIIQLLFMSPMPPWTNPHTICLATLWIPFELCAESVHFQLQRSLGCARLKEFPNFIFPKWARILFLVHQMYYYREIIFQGVSAAQVAHLNSVIRESWSKLLGVT
jgi:hypothetical protein